MSALISIIIPAYNAATWIGSTIDSAVMQDWQRKEIIIVDDGSTDETLKVARAKECKFIKVITQENRGAAVARNSGLAVAQGDYIQWLDADDVLAPDKLSTQLRRVEAGDGANVLLSSAFGTFISRPQRSKFSPHALWQDLAPIDFLLMKFTNNLWMSPGVWLVSRSLTERAGPWDERLSLDDDGEYFARVVSKSEGIRFVPEARVYYRQAHVGSLSRRISDRACISLLLSLRLCIDHLLSLEKSERTRDASLQLLQNWIDRGTYFYPDRAELVCELNQLARDLGGSVRSARLDWKYRPVRALFGWNAVRRAKALVADVKLRSRILAETCRTKVLRNRDHSVVEAC
ncbi:MAG: glycosyltransferase family 2 protein [Rhodospirillales bacterium]